MKITVQIPFQSEISYENNQLKAVGSKNLLLLLQEQQTQHGKNPHDWKKIPNATTSEIQLVNQFIRKLNQTTFVYPHDELCHCRSVKTDQVCEAIMAGCRQVSEVSRTTLAGTGCGTCRQNIESIIKYLAD